MLPSIRLVMLTESLYKSANDVDSFTMFCGVQITSDDLSHIRPMLKQSLDFHAKISAKEPWVGYVTISSATNETPGEIIGRCGFKGNPNEENEVEIAYLTFSRCQSQGYATLMAEELFGIAQKSGELVNWVVAHTLPEENASTSVLRKNSFVFAGEVLDHDDGNLWRWKKPVQPGE